MDAGPLVGDDIGVPGADVGFSGLKEGRQGGSRRPPDATVVALTREGIGS